MLRPKHSTAKLQGLPEERLSLIVFTFLFVYEGQTVHASQPGGIVRP